MKVYISGPMTGRPNCNREAFSAAHASLQDLGILPLNPADLVVPTATWNSAMRICIAELMNADAVFMLDGWAHSRGAKIEHDLAIDICIPVFDSMVDLRRFANR